MRAILVSVDYTDLLAYTLRYNRHHFAEVCVVTSAADAANVAPVAAANRASVYVTDTFYARGATFNKWAALEEGLDHFGRNGWLCLMDADVLWPQDLRVYPGDNGSLYFNTWRLAQGQLCSPLRRMMTDLTRFRYDITCPAGRDWYKDLIPPEDRWGQYPVHRNVNEWAGYTQIFHAADPALGPPPWHDVSWRHAGGADSFFQARWDPSLKVRPPFEVLHLGEAGANWCGRATAYLDGTFPQGSSARAEEVRAIWAGRRGKQGPERFAPEKLP